MTAARQALLGRIIDHIAANGLSDLSLRELAEAVGSNHRMLNYHFGGRAGLVAAVVTENEQQQRALLAQLTEEAAGPSDVVRAQWSVLTDPAMLPHLRLFYELLALAFHQRPGTEGFLDGLTEPWLDAAAEAAHELNLDTSRAELRLGVAVMRGLLIEVLASGEVEPATESLERFLELWEQAQG